MIGVIAGCSTTRTLAPVVDRALPLAPSQEVPAAAVTPAPPKPVVVDAPGFYTVKKGDTLLRIALDHGLPYRDIVAWNNLTNPNEIKADQVLRLTVPEGAVVTSAVTQPVATDTRKNASASAVAAAAAAASKTMPRGDKKPYTETALADMQKAELTAVAPTAPTTAIVAAPVVATPPAVKMIAPKAADSDDDAVSWMWPAEGKVVAGFDEGKNKGIDIAGKMGQQVVAAGAGKIMYAGNAIRGYGNLVIVRHNNNVSSAYAHNATILVKEEQMVQKGQVIAEMGNSDADAVKLHFEIRQQGKPVDPSKLLPNR